MGAPWKTHSTSCCIRTGLPRTLQAGVFRASSGGNRSFSEAPLHQALPVTQLGCPTLDPKVAWEAGAP